MTPPIVAASLYAGTTATAVRAGGKVSDGRTPASRGSCVRARDPSSRIPAVHVALALLTLFPGRVGGSEANVRGLVGEFARGPEPQRLTVLANRHVMRAYEGAGVPLRLVRSYRP